MSKIKFLLVLLAVSSSLFAQNYPLPASVSEPPAICTGCTGMNSSGQSNNGLPTWPYPVPPFDFAGRFLDSYKTANVQNLGMRTIRARTVRAVPSRNRLYIQGGETVFVYSLDTFFSSRLLEGMIALNTIAATPAPGQGWGGRGGVYERLSRPDAFFYPEDRESGWVVAPVDVQRMLHAYDLDDRGYLYAATVAAGWGVQQDDGRTDGSHLPFVYQDFGQYTLNVLFVIRSGSNYYLAGSDLSANQVRVFDVTNPAVPVALPTRTGARIRSFAKDDAAQRLAIGDSNGKLRVYSYAGFAANEAPLAEYSAASGATFVDVTFDDSGNVWAAESPATGTGTIVKLNASTFTKTTYAFSSTFRGSQIHASGGYLAVMGFDVTANGHGVRLYDVRTGSPVEIATDDFVRQYYFRAPSGYANMWLYAEPGGVRIVKQGAKTYLMISAGGLGDVFEIPVIDTRITAINPASGPPTGGTSVSIFGANFPAGTPTVTFDGVNATSVNVTNLGTIVAVAPAHAPGAVNVVVQYTGATPMTAPQQFTYILEAPQNFVATGGGVSVDMTWNAVAGATSYEVSRYVGNAWQVISTQANTGYTDNAVSSAQTYAYRVRALDGTNTSAYATDFASTLPMTTSVTAGMSILASHITDVQNGVNAARAAAGLSASSFPSVSAGNLIHRADVLLPRNALNEARTALGFAPLTYTDGYPTTVRAVHVQELLDAVR